MFENYNMCCFKSMYPFLKISNYTKLDIYFIIQYTLSKGTKTKTSPVFKNGHYEKINFSPDAKNIAFNILTSPMHTFICNRTLPTPSYYKFNVVETPSGPICVQD